MGNIYINKTEKGTWDCSIGENEGGVLFVEEKGYPVEVYYKRFDLNGSSILERDICKNEKELIEALKWHGQCNHLIEEIWDFNLDTCTDANIVNLFNEAYSNTMDNIRKEWDAMAEDMADEVGSSKESSLDEKIVGAKKEISGEKGDKKKIEKETER